jgi:hypothetical protein
MHANHRAALRTRPFNIFVFDKIDDANFLYAYEIFKYTCSVIGSIALIQMGKACARKLVTFEAILNFPFYHLFTVFNFARNTGFRFRRIIAPATGTRLFIPCIGSTEAAIYAAWGYQGWIG